MLSEKFHYSTLALLSTILIVGRAFLYFQGALSLMVLIEILFIFLFIALILIEKRSIYFAIFSFLSSISLYYIGTRQAIYDLTPLSIFFTVYIFRYFIELKNRPFSIDLKIIFITYLILINITLIGLLHSVNTQIEDENVLKLFKYVIFLAQASYCGFIFSFVYQRKDKIALQIALLTAIICYFCAASIGYFFPAIPSSDNVNQGFLYKSMFRYPGLSTSNFTGHILLLMTAIHMQLSFRKNIILYACFVTLLSAASQSRSVTLGGAILLFLQIVEKKHKVQTLTKTKNKKAPKAFAVLLIAFLVLTLFSDQTRKLYLQLLGRFQGKIAYENIPSRISYFQEAYKESTAIAAFFLFGHGYIHRDANPHNLFLSSMLLFGWPATALIFLMTVIIISKIPKSLFIFMVSQFEILFFTSIYDFLFIIFVLICISRRILNENWNREPKLSS